MLDELLGIRMSLWLGRELAAPAPAPIADALRSVEVTQSVSGRDGFQLSFTLGRGTTDLVDYPLMSYPFLRPFSRVIIMVSMGVVPEVLIDGFITNHQVSASNEAGASTLTITGEDMRVMMDLHEISLSYPQMTQDSRVRLILAKYMTYLGAPPVIIPPLQPDMPAIVDRIPAQTGTDLSYVESLARNINYVFYVEPTSAPHVNIAYWGPEKRHSVPQAALSVNMGPESNVTSMSFSYDALQPTTVMGLAQDRQLGVTVPVVALTSMRPPLAALPATIAQLPHVRSSLPAGGANLIQTLVQAEARVSATADAVRAQGELDTTRYGHILRPRRLVGVRGAGYSLDGLYFVERVTHRLRKGDYTQSFSLAREGFGSTTPVVIP